MKDIKLKSLSRLSRTELLELLLAQTQETERLQEKLKKAEAILMDRQLKIQNAGDLAHAVLEINNVMGSAQQAAQQYVENMAAMEAETKAKCEELIREAMEQAAQIRKDAEDSLIQEILMEQPAEENEVLDTNEE